MQLRFVIALVSTVSLFAAAERAEGAPVLWQYAGQVLGYTSPGPPCALCPEPLAEVLPIGSRVELDWYFDPSSPEFTSCIGQYPDATTQLVLRLAGNEYTFSGKAYTWVDAFGFSGSCGPNGVGLEVVAPAMWTGPALPGTLPNLIGVYPGGGISGFSGSWDGPGLPTSPPLHLGMQSPMFSMEAGGYQGVTTSLTPVPEPSTLLLLGSGLATLVARRRRRRA